MDKGRVTSLLFIQDPQITNNSYPFFITCLLHFSAIFHNIPRISPFFPVTSTLLPIAKKIPRSNHNVSRRFISENALKVISRLSSEGFEAYLVGGAVRDMMLGKTPKDFDIATDATPEELRKLFRNARIIGRRFRIVHILFGPEIIEVTTFRGHHREDEAENPGKQLTGSTGILLRDNVYGSMEEDALRRDFSINALYYSSRDFCIYDFTNGAEDIERKTLRIIGDPVTRMNEDPVRILRAIRFSAKLGFHLEPATKAAIEPCRELLSHIPPARLFDELVKLFTTGNALESYELLKQHDILGYLLSSSALITKNSRHESLVKQALINTDSRIESGKTVNPAFMYAVFLWPRFSTLWNELEQQGVPSMAALHEASQRVFQEQSSRTAIPKRIQLTIKEIWELQPLLQKRPRNKLLKVSEHPRFRAGYDFLLLREQSGELPPGAGAWWTSFQEQTPESQQQSILNLAPDARPKKRRRRRKPSAA